MAKREVNKHTINMEFYEGRCQPDVECFSTFLSKGGTLDEGEVMEKYEIRLPIPKDDEEAKDFYDLDISDLVFMGVAKLATSIDDKVKPTLFDDDGNADEDSHLAAQAVADAWRYKARVARGKSVEVQEVLDLYLNAGKISEEEAEKVETKPELMRLLAIVANR
jgi:hypothetical protein